MKIKLSKRVISCFVGGFALSSLVANVFASAVDYSFQIPPGQCVVATSVGLEKSILAAAMARLKSRYSANCVQLPYEISDPYSEASMSTWRIDAGGASFGFWIDLLPGGAELIVRGIDVKSLLQWEVAKATTVRLSEDSKANLVKGLIDQVVDQYPFVGFIEGRTFYTWTKTPNIKVTAVRLNRDPQESIERHPFLPFLLSFRSIDIPDSTAQLQEDAGKKWKLSFSHELQAQSGERLWLKPGP